MKTQPEIERSFREETLYEYAYHAASTALWESEEALWYSDQAYRMFYQIQTGEIEFPFTREDYDKNTDIQNSLALIGLDPDKFWQALLYIHAVAFAKNTDVVPVDLSVQDRIEDLISAIGEDGTGVSITIKRPGRKTTVITDPQTMWILSLFLQNGNKKCSLLNMMEYTGSAFSIDPMDLGTKWRIYDEYCAFKSIFKRFCTDGDLPKRVSKQKGSRDKDLLISRILYMTKVVNDEQYTKSRNLLHAIVDKCQKTERPRCDWEGGFGNLATE